MTTSAMIATPLIPTRTAPDAPATARPSMAEEAAAFRLFLALSPRLPHRAQEDPPRFLGPFAQLEIPRRYGRGTLSGTWFPARGEARGAVLMVHPWNSWGKSYFNRRGRISALRQAGHHVLAFDLPGFGTSGRPDGFYDRDVEDALDVLALRAEGLPLFLWGVSAGGYWAHPALARNREVRAAMFEDVATHFLDWSARMQPLGLPCYRLFRLLFPRAYRFLDLRRHARALNLRAAAYVGGERDAGIPLAEQRALARLAGARHRAVPDAGHLESIKRDRRAVIALALATFDGS